MRSAFHPLFDRPITIEGYYQAFGRRRVDGVDSRPKARCPFCRVCLNDRAGTRDVTTAHFYHPGKSGFCPSKAGAGQPYLVLTPAYPDTAHAKFLKIAFRERWEWHFHKLSTMVKFFSVSEFMALIGRANELRIWEYKNLLPTELPYVMVLLADFPPDTGICKNGVPLRKYWFRFWYDARIRSLDDLWIKCEEPTMLFRASYYPPKRKGAIPGLDSLVKFYPIPRDSGFLHGPKPGLGSFPLKHIPPFLEKLLQD